MKIDIVENHDEPLSFIMFFVFNYSFLSALHRRAFRQVAPHYLFYILSSLVSQYCYPAPITTRYSFSLINPYYCIASCSSLFHIILMTCSLLFNVCLAVLLSGTHHDKTSLMTYSLFLFLSILSVTYALLNRLCFITCLLSFISQFFSPAPITTRYSDWQAHTGT